MVEVGSNQGDYIDAALSINPNTQIFGFEPHPKNFEKLKIRFSKQPNVIVTNRAMSFSSGSLKIYDYLENDGSCHASLFKDVITSIHGSHATSEYDVDVTTLDEFVVQNGIESINLLKIDTEGSELNVLSGAKLSLNAGKIKAIHFEFYEMNVESTPKSRSDKFSKLILDKNMD